MHTVLIVIHLLIAVALICVILMQRTAQDGGGLMGGSGTMGGLFTARGSANLLTRTTAVLATLFMVMSLLLGIIAAHQHTGQTLAEQIAPLSDTQNKTDDKAASDSVKTEKAAAPTPAKPAVPVSK